jgi:hypothetical protein
MYCVIQFYIQLRKDLAPHQPFLKVLAIKLVVFLSFWQIFTMSILTSQSMGVLKPTKHLSYPSLKIGIPALALCVEMALFALMHLWAFPWQPYRAGTKGSKYPLESSGIDELGPNQGGFLGMKAFIDAMNPWDLVKAFARSMRWLFVGVKNRERDSSYNFNNNSMEISNEPYKFRGDIPLPIADEFRRSRFGIPKDEEGAGLIANAQQNPVGSGPLRSPYMREGSYGMEDGRESQDIGVAISHSPEPYKSPMEQKAYVQTKRQQQGHNVMPSTQWMRGDEPGSSKPDVHNTLWGTQQR